ncbi:MAG: hypothetical protein Q4D51_10985 [Eubacteriales bacterium]|nr:hypothetical protein [Eubacteriales bacterium]
MKDVLENIFFTEYDDKITGTSQRDPLGLQPIWSFYGRRVVKHLTTVSTDIRGFREVLLCLSICNGYKEKKNTDWSYRNLILVFEQLFIYTMIDKNLSNSNISIEGIIGADNGKSKFVAKGKNPEISAQDTILVNEISLGYYGRYKTPLSTMGVINKNNIVFSDIDVMKLYGSDNYRKIFSAFSSFVERKENDRCFKNFKARNELFEAVCGTFRLGEKDFWLEKLQVEGDYADELMRTSYYLTCGELNSEGIIHKLIDSTEAKEIALMEPFLRCMESVFNRALETRRLDSIVINENERKEHIRRFNDFIQIERRKDKEFTLLDKRLEFIKTKCSPESDMYVKSIIDYHTEVCKQKKSSVWIEVDSNGNIQSYVESEGSISLDDWGRNYYLTSLASVRYGIEELSR